MNELADAKILLLEDEPNLGQTLLDCFSARAREVVWTKNLVDARNELKLSSKSPFSLALLDVGLPDGSGFDLAQELQLQSRSTSILFLSAFGSPEDRIRGLEIGAEDYVVKPFHLKELLLRVENILKRTRMASAPTQTSHQDGSVQIGKAKIYFAKFEAQVGKTVHPLTHKETALLRLLYEKNGEVVSRDDILNQIWSEDEFPTARTVDNFILKLRKLIEETPSSPQLIRSVRGVGYQLSHPERKTAE